MNNILKAVCIGQEVFILNVIILISIDQSNSLDILLTNLEMERIEDLTEDFRGDLEVAKGITILEEACSIESVSSDFFTEAVNDLSDAISFSLSSLASSVDSLGSGCTNGNIVVLL
jgi:hypothetical protein